MKMLTKFLSAPEHISSWNQKIRMSYWLIGLITVLAVTGAFFVVAANEPHRLEAFIHKQVIIRIVLIVGTLIAAELVYLLISKAQDYIIIALGSCIGAITLALSSPEVHGVHIVMILPILVGILHFNYGKVVFASGISMFCYMLVIVFVPLYRYEVAFYQKAVGFSFIMIVTLAALGIVNRGLRMMEEEKEALTNEKKHRLEQLALQEVSRVDALTGLENHKTFQIRYREAMSDDRTHSFHLAILDIDNFKAVNDNFGHSIGDLVLRKVGRLLKDYANENVLPSRYGGEEFTIIFRNMDNKQVTGCLERMREGTEKLHLPELEGRGITVSIGCHKREPGEDRDLLFRLADEALYLAKRSGKNRIAW
ncbi:GGDEF domain-containing protein [Paenibacillus luteus]|uniref:GGDEF domain-containing protein n=1 Tax=Paenibacillus luteus TaxID=2545753 RepID=UPI0019D591EC|nr:GGDEF domain-containing protein [Paenibacillus luteus]